ncbi:hypothetical protein SCUCBS95973_001679 [Sporothrix curviconia]|uniref:Zn(2)-C6 fungal-type domain-containing protein n=1 Tax=Sporothrix curviconia TaxID=1260050 RepID=A0ABP0B0M8_9PEZI
MSSHDQPPPPPPSSALRSPARISSPGIGGGMSMAATAAASLARASLAPVTTGNNSNSGSGAVPRMAAITDASPTTTAAAAAATTSEEALHSRDTAITRSTTTTATAAASLTGSPQHHMHQQAAAPACQPERLPSLTSIFGHLDRPLPPKTSPAGPPPLRGSYGRPASPGLPTPQSAYLPLPQGPTPTARGEQQLPPAPSYHHSHSQSHYQQPPSPRSYEHEQQHQQHQQSSSHQWSDSRSGYVAVGKWSLQDGAKTEQRPSYSEHRSSYSSQHSSDSQRFSQPFPPSHQPPSHSYHRHGSHSNPPPPPLSQQQQHSSRSPVRGPALVAEGRQSSLSGSLPPTPGSAAFPEGGALPKEGMGLGVGPKIWTGQDFLPQFLRVAEVPGEGTCYFYDDGTHCKAVIDGEAVNPYWGVTKAGKPRKRLAIACMTCREKKIKCDPEYPRCVQCEKFGRLCRFKNAPRGGNNNNSATAAEPEALRKTGSVSAIRPPQAPETSPRSLSYAHMNSVSNGNGNGNNNDLPHAGMGLSRPLSPTSSSHGGSISNKRRSDYDHYTTATNRSRSSPFSNHSPTLSDVSRGSGSVLPPPHGWGSTSSTSQQSSSQLPPPPSSYPRSQQPYSPHSQYSLHVQQQQQQQHHHHHHHHHQYSPHPQYASHSQAPPPPPSAAYDHQHRHSYPDHDGYPPSQPPSQSPSPSQPDLPRMLLPPPRSTPDLPRVHDDVLRRSWQSDLRPHGRA